MTGILSISKKKSALMRRLAAIFSAGGVPPTGIQYVVVNGTVVVRDSKVLKGVFPGQAVRGAVL